MSKVSGQIKCILCGTVSPMIVAEKEDVRRWHEGALIQNALPYLTDDEREWLISSMCPKCFDGATKEDA